nr:nonribosomal peptide synthase [Colletotrichum truncatum]KAF6798030.1 nonribosomal peptide synthase [Colletotrichum truncatum]
MLSPSQKVPRLLWAKVLKVEAESIDPDENFFSIGGDSILAMRLIAAGLEESIRLPVLTIMRFPDVSDLEAPNISQSSKANYSSSDINSIDALVCPQPPNMRNEFPATSFQEAVLSFNTAASRGFLNYFVLSLDSRLDSTRLETACRSLLMQHPVLRSSFFHTENRLLQNIRPLEAVQLQKHDIGPREASEPVMTMDADIANLIENGRRTPLA